MASKERTSRPCTLEFSWVASDAPCALDNIHVIEHRVGRHLRWIAGRWDLSFAHAARDVVLLRARVSARCVHRKLRFVRLLWRWRWRRVDAVGIPIVARQFCSHALRQQLARLLVRLQEMFVWRCRLAAIFECNRRELLRNIRDVDANLEAARNAALHGFKNAECSTRQRCSAARVARTNLCRALDEASRHVKSRSPCIRLLGFGDHGCDLGCFLLCSDFFDRFSTLLVAVIISQGNSLGWIAKDYPSEDSFDNLRTIVLGLTRQMVDFKDLAFIAKSSDPQLLIELDVANGRYDFFGRLLESRNAAIEELLRHPQKGAAIGQFLRPRETEDETFDAQLEQMMAEGPQLLIFKLRETNSAVPRSLARARRANEETMQRLLTFAHKEFPGRQVLSAHEDASSPAPAPPVTGT
jgi:hypothetical protein